MSGDGSFPHQIPHEPDEEAPPPEEPAGARVFEFPSEDLPTPTPIGSIPVPAGTWADEGERPGDVERLLKPAGTGAWSGGEVVEFPRQPNTRRRPKPVPVETKAPPRDVSGTQVRHEPTETGAAKDEPTRPAFLASELLDRDWRPPHPLRHTLRWAAVVLGISGAIGAPVLGGASTESLGLAVAFALCGAAGLAPLAPHLRGISLAVIGGLGAAWVAAFSAASSAATPLLVGCVTLTASALFFRAAHNRSKLARALVGVGLLGTAAWLALTGGIDAVVVESLDWQSWVGPGTRLLLAATAVLSLLTFLDPTGPGGSWVAGYVLLGWLALSCASELVLGTFPLRGDTIAPSQAAWVAGAALPGLVALASGGLCQVWVLASRRILRA